MLIFITSIFDRPLALGLLSSDGGYEASKDILQSCGKKMPVAPHTVSSVARRFIPASTFSLAKRSERGDYQ